MTGIDMSKIKKALKVFWEIVNGKEYVFRSSVWMEEVSGLTHPDGPGPVTREEVYYGKSCFGTGVEIPSEDNQKNILVPRIEIERKHCPFYGFWNTALGIIIDLKNNDCGLLNFSPCCMEEKGKTPCWETCEFNTKTAEKVRDIFREVRICPREFDPQESSWGGINFLDWLDYLENQFK